MQQYPKNGVIQPIKDLEVDFIGLKYSKLMGIDKYGKIKNIYTESYPESSELRVWIPEIITRDNPEIELTLYFVGVNRRSVYHQFVQYISGSITLAVAAGLLFGIISYIFMKLVNKKTGPVL